MIQQVVSFSCCHLNINYSVENRSHFRSSYKHIQSTENKLIKPGMIWYALASIDINWNEWYNFNSRLLNFRFPILQINRYRLECAGLDHFHLKSFTLKTDFPPNFIMFVNAMGNPWYKSIIFRTFVTQIEAANKNAKSTDIR